MTLKHQHLLGLPFDYANVNCYTMLRRFYADNFGIHFPNYACPTEFWKHGLDLYITRAQRLGFKSLDCHPSEYQFGDVFIMSIASSIGNHCGILVENGQMLHHFYNQLSDITPYKGVYRNTTVAVFRHKDVKLSGSQDTTPLKDLVSSNTRRKIDEALKDVKVPS
ncbi:NlpC/P60 family protein [Mesorhizobium sp. M0016]|uniref:NlpC/P60 family protein n=1 Tax=Mesorhizobium sp. M0016 TaxID=2956843 RepID=UPI003334C7EF